MITRNNRSTTIQRCALILISSCALVAAHAADPPPHSQADSNPKPASTSSSSSGNTTNSNNSSSSSKNNSSSSSSNASSGDGHSGWCWPWLNWLSFHPSRSTLERLNIQVGTFSPVSSAIPTTDSSWESLEISYNLAAVPRSQFRFVPNIYLDTAGTDGENVYHSRTVNVTNGRMLEGLGLGERARLPLFHGAAAASFGAGAGLYCLETFHHYSYADDDTSDCGCSADDYHTDRAGLRGGYRLFAGLNHRNGLYIEAGWINAGSMNGLGYSGSTISIGFRR